MRQDEDQHEDQDEDQDEGQKADGEENADIRADSELDSPADDAVVDRDDDGLFDLPGDADDVDSSGSNAVAEDGGNSPDPGYAAFADDFDDPLADWPGPDATVEVDLADEPDGEADDPFSGDTAAFAEEQQDAFADEPPLNTQDAEEDAATESGELAFPEAHLDDEEQDQAGGPSLVDIDEPTDGPVAASINHGGDAESPLTDPALESSSPAPVADSSASDSDDEFVDDFLADLDSASETSSDAARTALNNRESEAPAGRPRRGDPEIAGARLGFGGDGSRSDDTREESTSDAEERRAPFLMIAVVVAALALLGWGGYGVVQERKAMEAEIRELQANLATAMTPGESSEAREQLRQMEVEAEALRSQLQTLRGENLSLEAQLEDIADRADALANAAEPAPVAIAGSVGGGSTSAEPASARQETGASAARTAAPAQSAGAVASNRSDDDAAGNTPLWFVNFGSYTRRLMAEQWAEQLQVEDGEVIVQTATAGERTVYRVRVIGLPNRDAAERVALQLERSFQLPRLWIGRQ